MPRLLCLLTLAALAAGCDGPLSLSQRLAGEWVGRPETAVERTLREWPGVAPGDGADPADPEVAAAVAESVPTDLEGAGPIRVGMRLEPDGRAVLTLAGEPEVSATWTVSLIEGRRSELKFLIPAEEGGAPSQRRFDLEFTRDDERFTLRESGADRQLGRLLFTRPGADKPAPSPKADP